MVLKIHFQKQVGFEAKKSAQLKWQRRLASGLLRRDAAATMLSFALRVSGDFYERYITSIISPHFSRICVARRSERFCDKVGVVDDEVLGEYTLLEEETSQTL